MKVYLFLIHLECKKQKETINFLSENNISIQSISETLPPPSYTNAIEQDQTLPTYNEAINERKST